MSGPAVPIAVTGASPRIRRRLARWRTRRRTASPRRSPSAPRSRNGRGARPRGPCRVVRRPMMGTQPRARRMARRTMSPVPLRSSARRAVQTSPRSSTTRIPTTCGARRRRSHRPRSDRAATRAATGRPHRPGRPGPAPARAPPTSAPAAMTRTVPALARSPPDHRRMRAAASRGVPPIAWRAVAMSSRNGAARPRADRCVTTTARRRRPTRSSRVSSAGPRARRATPSRTTRSCRRPAQPGDRRSARRAIAGEIGTVIAIAPRRMTPAVRVTAPLGNGSAATRPTRPSRPGPAWPGCRAFRPWRSCSVAWSWPRSCCSSCPRCSASGDRSRAHAPAPTRRSRRRPPSAEPTPVPEPTPQTYVIKSGDTLSRIAREFGVTLDALLEANKDRISNPNRIAVGDEIDHPSAAGRGGPGRVIPAGRGVSLGLGERGVAGPPSAGRC